MPANVYLRTVTPSGDWQPLAASSTTVNAMFRIWTSGMAPINPLYLRGPDGEEAQLLKNTFFTLEGVDLAEIKIKGEGGYRVTITGNTRQ